MPQSPDPFRDFGILPPDTAPKTMPVRSYFSGGRVFGQYLATGLVASLGAGIAVLLSLFMEPPLNILGGSASLGAFGVFIFLMTRNDRRWVELDGTTVRARHLYTGRIIERSVGDIESLNTVFYPVANAAVLLVEKMWGRIKGIEIRFRDRRTPLAIMRSDPAMTNAKELIEAVMARMQQQGELDIDVIELDGSPIIKQVRRKGEAPMPQASNVLRVLLGCLLMLTLIFGGILGLIAGADSRTHAIGSVPPQRLTVAELIAKGPGENRHVTVTDFRIGGYAFEGKNGVWRQVWVPLFPRNDPGQEMRVLLTSNQIAGEAALRAIAQSGQVTGICSASPRTTFGTVLGPQLREANRNAELNSVWTIDELRSLPDAATTRTNTIGSTALLSLTVLMALALGLSAMSNGAGKRNQEAGRVEASLPKETAS